MLEVLPLTHIRGRSLHDAFVIVDEAQSLERNVLLTVLSRLGTASRVVLTHDVAQRDNLRVGRHDGVAAVIEKLKGHPLFAHVTLTRSERQPDRRAGHRDAGGPRRCQVPLLPAHRAGSAHSAGRVRRPPAVCAGCGSCRRPSVPRSSRRGRRPARQGGRGARCFPYAVGFQQARALVIPHPQEPLDPF